MVALQSLHPLQRSGVLGVGIRLFGDLLAQSVLFQSQSLLGPALGLHALFHGGEIGAHGFVFRVDAADLLAEFPLAFNADSGSDVIVPGHGLPHFFKDFVETKFPALHGCAVGDGIAVPKVQDLADPGVEGLRPAQAQPETPVQQQRGRERQPPATLSPFFS